MNKSLLIFPLSVFFLNISCKKEIRNQSENIVNTESSTEKSNLQTFSIILSKAVSKNKPLRDFIKAEALKQKDNDFDVIYELCKNEKIADDKTFRDMLIENETFEGAITKIETELPTITVLVPTLPNDSFTPQNWSTENQIPMIGYVNKTDVDMYLNGEKSMTLKNGQIPGFPTLVVKNNERIRMRGAGIKASSKSSLSTTRIEFVHEAYDGINNPTKPYSEAKTESISKLNASANRLRANSRTSPRSSYDRYYFESPQIHTDAYNKFLPQNGGWQRDYIYYNLDNTPDAKGGLNQTMTESIMAIKINPGALKIIQDEGDPTYNTNFSIHSSENIYSTAKMWTEGNFDIQIDIVTSDVQGGGSATSQVLSIPAIELFDVQYTTQTYGRPTSGDYTTVYTFKEVLPKYYYCNIPIKEWNLQHMGYTWKISVRENDKATTYMDSEKVSTKFATNFSIEPSTGILNKIGLKFGASAERVEEVTSTVQRTQENDFIGDALVSFGDAVLTSSNKLEDTQINSFIVDLKTKARRESATKYINVVEINRRNRTDPPPFYSAEQDDIKATAKNVYPLSNFNKVYNNNFEIVMVPVYKY